MYKKNAVHTRFILITTLKRIHCCISRFRFRDKGPLNNIPSSTFSPKKQQHCNLDHYSFVYVSSLQGELLFVSVMEQITLKNSVLVVKKQHDFVAGVKDFTPFTLFNLALWFKLYFSFRES